MEFKYRSVDCRPPNYLSSLSGVGYFSEPAMGAVRSVDCRPPNHFSSPSGVGYFSEQAMRANYSTVPNYMQNPLEFYTIQREIEKERIRQEILISENVRRRLLEEEVRRELMMEREMATGGHNSMGLSLGERITMRLDPMFPGNCGMGFGLNAVPPSVPRVSDAMMEANKSASEENKEKLIMLAKPDPNLCGSKRKAETQAEAANDFLLPSSKKRPKEDWRCDICQVNATCQSGLNSHLEGRKHKAKLRRLRAKKLPISSDSKESEQPFKLKDEIKDMSLLEEEKKVEEGLDSSEKKTEGGDNLKNQNYVKVHKKRKWKAKNKKKTEGPTEKSNKNFKFFCEICEVGAYNEIVMSAHKKGRKHMARINEINQDGEVRADANNVFVEKSCEPTAEKAKEENGEKASDEKVKEENDEKAIDAEV